MTTKQKNEPSVREAEELLKQMANIEPLTRQEVCDWYGIDLKDFPRLACANLEREIEMNRHAPSEHLTQQGLQMVPVDPLSLLRSIPVGAGIEPASGAATITRII